MALKDQPYLPLYVQDVLTDEKLIECSAESQGVYFRLLCVLHKQEEYGCFLLKQKYKQTTKQIVQQPDQQVLNFASALVRPLAMNFDVIKKSLEELITEKVLFIEGDKLCQKRMIRDAELSAKRARAGRSGGISTAKKTGKKKNDFAVANYQANIEAKEEANTEIEIENENEYENEYENDFSKKEKGGLGEKEKSLFLIPRMLEVFSKNVRGYPADPDKDTPALGEICRFIERQEGLRPHSTGKDHDDRVIEAWEIICRHIAEHHFFKTYSIYQVSKHIQSIIQDFKHGKRNNQKTGSGVDIQSAIEKLNRFSD